MAHIAMAVNYQDERTTS